MARRMLTISHPSELAQLRRWPGFRPRGPRRVHLDLAEVPRERVSAWEDELTRLYNACGCDTGALALALGLVGYGVWLALRPEATMGVGWADAGRALVVAVTATLVGKIAGLWMARRRLDRTLDVIRSEWRKPPLAHTEPVMCG